MKRPTHLQFIRTLPCLICGNDIQTEAAHIRYAKWPHKPHTGMGHKPSDEWTIPLCSNCHRAQHKMNERKFWKSHRIDPINIAQQLYMISGNYQFGCAICEQVLNKRLTHCIG